MPTKVCALPTKVCAYARLCPNRLPGTDFRHKLSWPEAQTSVRIGRNLRGHRHAVPVPTKVCAYARDGLCPFVGTGTNFGGA